MWLFFFIFALMKYLIWLLYDYDEKLETHNVFAQFLSRKSWQDNYVHFENCYMSQFEILQYVWVKNDIINFIEENPEAINWEFKTYKSHTKRGNSLKNYEEYCKIREDREQLLKQLI